MEVYWSSSFQHTIGKNKVAYPKGTISITGSAEDTLSVLNNMINTKREMILHEEGNTLSVLSRSLVDTASRSAI